MVRALARQNRNLTDGSSTLEPSHGSITQPSPIDKPLAEPPTGGLDSLIPITKTEHGLRGIFTRLVLTDIAATCTVLCIPQLKFGLVDKQNVLGRSSAGGNLEPPKPLLRRWSTTTHGSDCDRNIDRDNYAPL